MLLDVQMESDQVSVPFRYPLALPLANLVHELKQTTAVVLQPIAVKIDDSLSHPDDIWSDAYLIASCPAPTPEAGAADPLLASSGGQP